MYNRYIPGSGGYTRVVIEEDERPAVRAEREDRSTTQKSRPKTGHRGPQEKFKNRSAPLGLFAGEDKNAGIAGILKWMHLEDLDSGDILLLLIILFVFLEGDNIELVITLGLMLLLGLGEEKKGDQSE